LPVKRTRSAQVEAHDFQPDHVVFDESGVKITAFTVDHGDLIKPGSRSVTLSGDTKFSENLIKFAGGTDLKLHHVARTGPGQAETA
jgi:ribonuclease Z